MTWQEFEDNIRSIAGFRWNCNAVAETIAGVKCDCVLKPEPNKWVIIEITKEESLEKVRTDIAKLNIVRHDLFARNIFSECYIVMEKKPTDSERQSADAVYIKLRSADEFRNEYFEYNNYIHRRRQKPFGSLINIETGEPENNVYVGVTYRNNKSGKELYIKDIIDLLKKGRRVVLKGDYGLGKSRCIKQIFDSMTDKPEDNPYAIAINLREHWGAKRATEIITRHFDELGLDAKNFIKTYDRPNTIYLLDGFDEIGTQSWTMDTKKMQHIREMSVSALKDLIRSVHGGVLITGREYYFNSDEEMLSCFGLTSGSAIILECHQEFSDTELLEFISGNIPEAVGSKELEQLPVWLPKRPLVIQLLIKYASDIFSMDYALEDICGFWYAFLSKICEREARIYPALNPEIIKRVLLHLADKTRLCASNMGPITQEDLSDAFNEAAGFRPNDESSIMLQRLPSLGRINADSPDRQFLDGFILNGLRAESVIQLSKSWDKKVLEFDWINPLDQVGISILSAYISKDEKRVATFLTLARNAASSRNRVLAADIVCALCLLDVDSIDFKDLEISGGHFQYLSFEGKEIRRLHIDDSIIEKLDLTNSMLQDSVNFKKCDIISIYGIASHKSIPLQIEECDISNFEMLATTTLIKRAKLSESQKLFVEILRKIFYQPGAGRKEAALLRGMGVSANRILGQKILGKLMDEHLITRIKGDEGYVYKPVRSEMGRIDKMMTDLTLSTDPLWQVISQL